MTDLDNEGVCLLWRDLSSVKTRSRVGRGFRDCGRGIGAPGFTETFVMASRVAGGRRFGDGSFGPPSFWQSRALTSGRRAP